VFAGCVGDGEGGDVGAGAGLLVRGGGRTRGFAGDAYDFAAGVDLSTGCTDEIGDMLPELAGAEFRIEETLDKGSVDVFLGEGAGGATPEGASEEVFDGRCKTEALDTLGTPLGGDAVAGCPPDLLGVALEEGEVEFSAEAVDEEVLETFFGLDLADAGAEVAEADAEGTGGTQVAEGGGGEADGVVEEAAEVVDATFSGADEHDEVGVGWGGCHPAAGEEWGGWGRVGSGIGAGVGGEGAGAAEDGLLLKVGGDEDGALLALVGDAGGLAGLDLGWHEVHPPLHDAVALGEEAVAADIHAVALVADGAGDAADLIGGLEDDGEDVGATKEFEGGGEACRPSADDDGSPTHRPLSEFRGWGDPSPTRQFCVKVFEPNHLSLDYLAGAGGRPTGGFVIRP